MSFCVPTISAIDISFPVLSIPVIFRFMLSLTEFEE